MTVCWMRTAARGQGFQADLYLAWEAEELRVAEIGIRVILLRTGMVLEQDGGALPKMLLPFRLFSGGPIMPGTQWVSWIHRRDHIGLIQWALTTPSVSGPVNAVAPEPDAGVGLAGNRDEGVKECRTGSSRSPGRR